MRPDALKNCSICSSANLNVFDVDAAGGHYPIWWCEDCGSLSLGNNDSRATAEHIRVWQPEHSMLNRQVLAFHKRFGQSIGEKPHVLDHKTLVFRLSLIAEEFCELLDATMDPMATVRIEEIRESFANVIRCPSDIDLPAAVDALADLQYVIEGAAITMGVNMTPILAEVQRANMAKLPSYVEAKDAMHRGDEIETDIVPIKRADGKIMKPPGWQPPNIGERLRAQGWDDGTHADFSGPNNDWKKL